MKTQSFYKESVKDEFAVYVTKENYPVHGNGSGLSLSLIK